MKPTVYLESSVVSYFANEISSDLKVAAEQRITREWWTRILPRVDPYVSEFVLAEISKGKSAYADARRSAIRDFTLLPTTDDIYTLANAYIRKLALPKNGEIDAYHLAMAAVHEVDFLLSWNCKHIANALKYSLIYKINTSLGYQSPTICTPRELMEM
jgi:hypothetical protein